MGRQFPDQTPDTGQVGGAFIRLQAQRGFGATLTMTGQMQDIHWRFLRHVRRQPLQRAAFFYGQIQAGLRRGIQDGGFLSLVIQAALVARRGGHEHQRQPTGRRRLRLSRFAQATHRRIAQRQIRRQITPVVGQ